MIKTIVKSKPQEKTTGDDLNLAQQAFTDAVEINGLSEIDFKGTLKTMTVPQLEALKDYIQHNKSTNEKKALAIAEYLPRYESMNKLVGKFNTAMENLRQMTVDSLSHQCGDEDGNIKMPLILDEIKLRIGIKEETAMTE